MNDTATVTEGEADPHLLELERGLEWCARQALDAFAGKEPATAAAIFAGLKRGEVRIEVTVTSGGNVPSEVAVIAIHANGRQPLAHITVQTISLN